MDLLFFLPWSWPEKIQLRILSPQAVSVMPHLALQGRRAFQAVKFYMFLTKTARILLWHL